MFGGGEGGGGVTVKRSAELAGTLGKGSIRRTDIEYSNIMFGLLF